MTNYIYIFTRQDISIEQQMVQTGHVTLKLGSNMSKIGLSSNPLQYCWSDPDTTHFTLVGVRNLDALKAVKIILDKFEFEYEAFFEEDMNSEMTSIALYPIPSESRGPLLAFNRLKVK